MELTGWITRISSLATAVVIVTVFALGLPSAAAAEGPDAASERSPRRGPPKADAADAGPKRTCAPRDQCAAQHHLASQDEKKRHDPHEAQATREQQPVEAANVQSAGAEAGATAEAKTPSDGPALTTHARAEAAATAQATTEAPKAPRVGNAPHRSPDAPLHAARTDPGIANDADTAPSELAAAPASPAYAAGGTEPQLPSLPAGTPLGVSESGAGGEIAFSVGPFALSADAVAESSAGAAVDTESALYIPPQTAAPSTATASVLGVDLAPAQLRFSATSGDVTTAVSVDPATTLTLLAGGTGDETWGTGDDFIVYRGEDGRHYRVAKSELRAHLAAMMTSRQVTPALAEPAPRASERTSNAASGGQRQPVVVQNATGEQLRAPEPRARALGGGTDDVVAPVRPRAPEVRAPDRQAPDREAPDAQAPQGQAPGEAHDDDSPRRGQPRLLPIGSLGQQILAIVAACALIVLLPELLIRRGASR